MEELALPGGLIRLVDAEWSLWNLKHQVGPEQEYYIQTHLQTLEFHQAGIYRFLGLIL